MDYTEADWLAIHGGDTPAPLAPTKAPKILGIIPQNDALATLNLYHLFKTGQPLGLPTAWQTGAIGAPQTTGSAVVPLAPSGPAASATVSTAQPWTPGEVALVVGGGILALLGLRALLR